MVCFFIPQQRHFQQRMPFDHPGAAMGYPRFPRMPPPGPHGPPGPPMGPGGPEQGPSMQVNDDEVVIRVVGYVATFFLFLLFSSLFYYFLVLV